MNHVTPFSSKPRNRISLIHDHLEKIKHVGAGDGDDVGPGADDGVGAGDDPDGFRQQVG